MKHNELAQSSALRHTIDLSVLGPRFGVKIISACNYIHNNKHLAKLKTIMREILAKTKEQSKMYKKNLPTK